MFKSSVNKKVFVKFIYSYLPIILLISFLQTVFVFLMLDNLKNNSVRVIENSVVGNVYSTERKIEQVRNIAFGISQNMSLTPYFKSKSQKDFTFIEYGEIKKILSSYSIGNPLIWNIIMQNDVSDSIISENTIYNKRYNFYKSFFAESEQFLINSETANDFNASGIRKLMEGGETVIPFAVPMLSANKRSGSIVVYIHSENLLSPMLDLVEKSGGAIRIFNKNKDLLVEEGKEVSAFEKIDFKSEEYDEIKANGKKYSVFSVEGEDFGWTYVLILPEKYVLGNTLFYRYVSFIFNVILVLFGFALSYFIAKKKSNSYLELLNVLGIEIDMFNFGLDEFKSLKPYISVMQQEKKDMAFGDNQHALNMLLLGGFEKKEEIEKELMKSKIIFGGSRYGVIVMHCENKHFSESFDKNFKSFMYQELINIIPGAYVFFADRNTIVMLFDFDYDDEKYYSQVRLYIARFEVEVFYKYHVPAIFGVGNAVDSLSDIKTAYMQANEVVLYNRLNGGSETWLYEELPDDNDDWYYPIEVEKALFESALEANFNQARDILQNIQYENFSKRNLSASNIKELLSEIKGSIKKISALQSEKIEFEQTEMSVKHFFEYAVNFFYVLCSDSENKSHTRGDKICEEIVEHINKNYRNASLSLVFYAELYNLNSSYLSRLFKKNVGTGLANYIESVRVNKATELLSDSSLTIADIAERVGFGSVSTFRRVFKKIKGVNPSDYIKR